MDFKTVALGLQGADAHAAALMRVADALTPALPVERIMPQDAGGRRVVAQDWTMDMAEWVDMSVLTIWLAQEMRRTCLVRIGGDNPAQGTGFLIGPQTVLTNRQVVHSLIDPATGAARIGPATHLRI